MTTSNSNNSHHAPPIHQQDPLTFYLGSEELIIYERYETLGFVNDLLIGTWFFIGSIFFLYPSMTKMGTWLFIIGSVEMLIRPAIGFARRVHLKHYQKKK